MDYDEEIAETTIGWVEIKKENLENKLNNIVIDLKFEMTNYVRQECVPMLEKFDSDVWSDILQDII
jgi:hypothetical protein